MAKIILNTEYLKMLTAIDAEMKQLTDRKLLILLEALGICPKGDELRKMLQWELIAITVTDRQMALQFNKLLANVPNVIFEVGDKEALFSLRPGTKKRRVRKDR